MADDRKSEQEHEAEAGRIKVTDRRHFTAEGARREPDAVSEPSPSPPPAMAPEPERPATAAPRSAGPRGVGETSGRPERRPPAPDEAPPSIDFVAFVQSLYVSALMALGEVENPYTRQIETNLDLARQNIDILSMLRDKTTGNLTREEDGFLEQVIPQLQLLFAKKAG